MFKLFFFNALKPYFYHYFYLLTKHNNKTFQSKYKVFKKNLTFTNISIKLYHKTKNLFLKNKSLLIIDHAQYHANFQLSLSLRNI